MEQAITNQKIQVVMINTKTKTLEYWLGERLKKSGEISQSARLRNKIDSWFIEKGFKPSHRAYSRYFSEYYNITTAQVIFVNEIDYFDDSLLGSNSWVVVHGFLMPYNALYDFGVMWEIRFKTYTDVDNSTERQLIDTLELLIENGIAYEL
jgi:hypothetical protein